MSKFKIVNIVDIIFISIAVLLIIFAWVQFFIKNLILSLIISAILATCTILLMRWLKSRKYNTIQSKIIKNDNFNKFRLSILTIPISKISTMVKTLIPKEYNPHITKGDINFVKNDMSNTFTFCFSNLSEDKLLELIKTKSTTNLTIFCNTFDEKFTYITKAFKNRTINIITLEQLFDIFNDNNIEIDTSNINLTNTKTTFKQMLKKSISRNKSKGYFISGLVLLFTSIIIPFRLYYVIFSSILFALSLICRFKPTPKINKSIFN